MSLQNRNHDLKRHKRIHLAVKPFGCDKCGKTFSRKDALRRHWLVKGCRGEEGATAPIIPMFPITASASRLPPLSPPTPPGSNLSPLGSNEELYPAASSSSLSLNRAVAPPPLNTMPPRTASIRSAMSQVIVTPNETGVTNPMSRSQQQLSSTIHLEEPIVIDSPMNGTSSGMQQGNNTPPNGGDADYFEMNLKTASNSNLLNAPMASPAHLQSSSPFSRSFPSPSVTTRPIAQHPYRRPNPSLSPGRMSSELHGTGQTSSSSPLNAHAKPIFAVPFSPDGYSTINVNQGNILGMDTEMERVGSGDSDPSTWQRWHRPSFPIPSIGSLSIRAIVTRRIGPTGQLCLLAPASLFCVCHHTACPILFTWTVYGCFQGNISTFALIFWLLPFSRQAFSSGFSVGGSVGINRGRVGGFCI